MLFVGLNNEDPGASFVAANFFALGDPAVSANLGFPNKIDGKTTAEFAKTLPVGVILGAQECAKRCGLKSAPVIRD
jgi:hypothetical protein